MAVRILAVVTTASVGGLIVLSSCLTAGPPCPSGQERDAQGQCFAIDPSTTGSTSTPETDSRGNDSDEAPTSGISAGDSSTTNSTFDCQSWWNTEWNARIALTIDWEGTVDDLTEVPVMVHLDATRIDYDRVHTEGADLRFVDHGGSELAYEVEHWEHGSDSWFWVKVPAVARNQPLFVYFDNANAAAQPSGDSVWSSDYVTVLHMDEAMQDAMGTTTPAESNTWVVDGKVGPAREFPSEVAEVALGNPEELEGLFLGDSPSGVTISGWINIQQIEDTRVVFSKGDDPSDTHSGYMLRTQFVDPDYHLEFHYHLPPVTEGENGEGQYWRVYGFVPGQWHWFAVSFDPQAPQNSILMLDTATAPLDADDDPTAMAPDTGFPLLLAPAAAGSGLSMLGHIDEFRIATRVRSLNWLLFQRRSTADELLGFSAAQSRDDCTAP